MHTLIDQMVYLMCKRATSEEIFLFRFGQADFTFEKKATVACKVPN